ncbi:MAG TPA: isoprenylcysteine carboxylmethyltransferase family protein [Gemmatimonadaceae bacterium]
MNRVAMRAWLGLTNLIGAVMLVVFLPARSPRYWQAWAYVAVFAACAASITWYLQRHDTALLERRLAAGPRAEKERRQKAIQLVASLAFLGLFVVSGLDHRHGWSSLSTPLVVAGDALVVVGFWIVHRTFRENSYTSAIIGTAEGQRVVSTGPYAVVRHPMYAGALLLLLGTPLALGSIWALMCFAVLVIVIVSRLLGEERLLARELPGSESYLSKVRYRLVPLVW